MSSLFPKEIFTLAGTVISAARDKKIMVSSAESCTGGLVSSALTEIAGSSDVFDRGFVTYSNAAKEALVFVDARTLKNHGAVSPETVMEMAAGALKNSSAQISVAVTGIAGPGGGSDTKPVGLVYIGIASPRGVRAIKNNFTGTRSDIRRATVEKALSELKAEIDHVSP